MYFKRLSHFESNKTIPAHRRERLLMSAVAALLCTLATPAVLQPVLAQEVKKIHVSDAEYNKAMLIYKNLSQVDKLLKEKRNVEARQYLEKLTNYDPNPYSGEVHGLLAETCYKLGNDSEAIKHYEIAIRHNPKDLSSYWNTALCYMHLSEYDNAIIWARKLLAHNPDAALKGQAQRFIEEMNEKKGDATIAGATASTGDYLEELVAKNDAQRWAPQRMPLRVYIQDPRQVEGFKPQYIQIFFDALTTWSNASGNKVVFVSARDQNDADLTLSFTSHPEDIAQKPGEPPIEQGLARTLVARDDGGAYGRIEKATIQILVIHPSNGKPCSDEEIKETCLHEIGHAIGLNGHSSGASDIMHFVQSFRQLPALTKRDRSTISKLYADYPTINQYAANNYSPAPRDNSTAPSQTQYSNQYQAPNQYPVQNQNQYQNQYQMPNQMQSPNGNQMQYQTPNQMQYQQ